MSWIRCAFICFMMHQPRCHGGREGWTKLVGQEIYYKGWKSSESLEKRPTAELHFRITKEDGSTNEPIIFVGPLPGVRYSVLEEGKWKERYFQEALGFNRKESDDPYKYFISFPLFEWYALNFESEQKLLVETRRRRSHQFKPQTLENAFDNYRDDVIEVIKGFKLPVGKDRAHAPEFFRKAFKDAVEQIKDAPEEDRVTVVMQAAQEFDEKTEEFLTKHGLQRNGEHMPSRIGTDPWFFMFDKPKSDKFDGHGSLRRPLGLGEYVLHLSLWRHYARGRLELSMGRLRKLNVAMVVTICSQVQVVGLLHRYNLPYGSGKKRGQEDKVTWDGSSSKLEHAYEQLKRSVGQPKEEASYPFAVSSSFLGAKENLFTQALKENDIEQMWPGWESSDVPIPYWSKTTRYRMFPDVEQTLRRGKNLYVHGKNSKGRVGLFVALLFMEITGAYWLDALNLLRDAVPEFVDSTQQIMFIRWYWAEYTAQYLPLKGALDAQENWDTAARCADEACKERRKKEMAKSVAPRGTPYSKLHVRQTSTLSKELERVRAGILSELRHNKKGYLIPKEQDRLNRRRKRCGVWWCLILYGALSSILGGLAWQFQYGEQLQPVTKEDSIFAVSPVVPASIELPCISLAAQASTS